MSGKNIRRLTLEALIIIAASMLFLIGGTWISSDKAQQRIQNNYDLNFGNVLEASYYRQIDSPIIEHNDAVNNVYTGYDDSGNIVGFVSDVTVTAPSGATIRMYTGVTYDGALLTGIKRINDENDPVDISDADIALIATQAIGMQIPVALEVNEYEVENQISVNPSLPGLNDGIYYAQKLEATSNGYIDFVEIEVWGGRITRVQWDAFNTDPTTKNRRDAALSGYYSVSGENWATQSYNLCHALIDLQDPSLIAMKSDGTTDIVEGVSTNIRAFIELVNECIENSEEGYTKEMYYDGLDRILEGIFGQNAEELGLISEDGYVVFSFDDYPNTFVDYDENGNPIGMLNVRQKAENDADDDYNDINEDEAASEDISGVGIAEEEEAIVTQGVSSEKTAEREGYLIPAEDGIVQSDNPDNVLIENVDGLPTSEIRTFIPGIFDDRERSQYIVTGINETYKFLKEYLNWMA